MLGTTVSHYKILEKIGAGGMGEVYLAEDTKLKRRVSLKFLPEELTRNDERKQRFVQEARAAAAIQHPHIAAVYDVDEADGRTFIAMEYVPGESLRKAIESGKLDFRRSLELGFQIADGLAKAHEKGVVHRDVKPDNVLITEDGYAKIIDFGLAKLLEPIVPSTEDSGDMETKLKTRDGLVMGTVSYMSPEQARGETIDARSDIFSFGVLFYEMISGRSPFQKKSVAESLSAVLHETPPALSSSTELPPDVRRVLRKALAKNVSERYQSMKDVAIDLKEIRDENLSSSRPAVPMDAPRKFPWPWVAVGAVALLGVVLGWALFGRNGGEPLGIGDSGRPAVAVMYFESLSGDEEIRWLSKGLPNMLITDLAQTPGLDVVSSERIQKILKQIGQEDLEHIDKSLVDEVAQRAGAGAVVVGSIFKSGSDVRIDVQVQDVSSGRILSADSVQGQDVFSLVDELTGRIRSSLQMGDSPADRPLADVTTPSLEAFQLFSDGLDARRNLRWQDARQLFERAVANDPSFAMAYSELVRVAQTLGETQLVEQYREKVMENIDRLPERQKLLVEARDAHRFEGDREKAIELFEALIAKYPDEADAYPELLRLQTNQPDQLAVAERGVEAVPSSGPLRNDYAYQLLFAGRYAEAVRQLETYVELDPGEPNPHDSLAEAYLFTGQAEKAVEMYGQALQIDPSFGPSHAGRAWAFSAMGRYDEALTERERLRQSENPALSPGTLLFGDAFILSRLGRYQDANATIREAQGLDEGAGLRVPLLLLSALTSLERGRFEEAVEMAKQAQALVPEVTYPLLSGYLSFTAPYLAGVAEARRGNLDAARAHLDAQTKTYEPGTEWQKWLHESLRGEIALAAGNRAAAEAAFSEGEPQFKMVFSAGAPAITLFVNQTPSRDGLGRVMKAQGDLAGAIRFYRALLTPDMSSKWTAMLEPRLVLELARLLDASGDKEAARTEYQRFLALWKDADEGLPELQEAREYLAN